MFFWKIYLDKRIFHLVEIKYTVLHKFLFLIPADQKKKIVTAAHFSVNFAKSTKIAN